MCARAGEQGAQLEAVEREAEPGSEAGLKRAACDPAVDAHSGYERERVARNRIADDGVLYVYLVRNPGSEEAPALASTAQAAEQDGGGSESRPLRMVDPWEEGGWSEAERLRLADPWEDGELKEAKPLRIAAHG